MKISIIHPSRSRADQAYNTYRNWMEKACNWLDIEYILSIDSDYIQNETYYRAFYSFKNSIKVVCMNNKNAIQAINNAAKVATGDLFVVISDDFDCPEHWDTLLLKEIEGKSDFLLKTDDGLQRTLVTLPIMDREYYNRFGYIYHPDYQHMHADEEMTIVAIMLGRYIKCDLKFEHLHYSTGKTPKDAINSKNDATWSHGQRTLDRRAMNDFGIDNPLCKREQIIWR